MWGCKIIHLASKILVQFIMINRQAVWLAASTPHRNFSSSIAYTLRVLTSRYFDTAWHNAEALLMAATWTPCSWHWLMIEWKKQEPYDGVLPELVHHIQMHCLLVLLTHASPWYLCISSQYLLNMDKSNHFNFQVKHMKLNEHITIFHDIIDFLTSDTNARQIYLIINLFTW